jgi:polyribonucleotide nucleotidyltransferase
MFIKLRAITQEILEKSSSQTLGAKLHMLTNIPVKFHDSRLNTFWATHDTNWKLQNFTKSTAITQEMLEKATSQTPGAKLHMLINIAVKFQDP